MELFYFLDTCSLIQENTYNFQQAYIYLLVFVFSNYLFAKTKSDVEWRYPINEIIFYDHLYKRTF